MMLKTITPAEAARLLRNGATLVDIREPDEHARERIPGARNLPVSRLEEADLAAQEDRLVLFHCRSGARTAGHAPILAAKAGAAEASSWRVGWRPGSAPTSRWRRITASRSG